MFLNITPPSTITTSLPKWYKMLPKGSIVLTWWRVREAPTTVAQKAKTQTKKKTQVKKRKRK